MGIRETTQTSSMDLYSAGFLEIPEEKEGKALSSKNLQSSEEPIAK